jgi:pimeloyl-ACP methyl ester carboxylesterase
MAKIPNVILIHGAWADGSSWAKVIPLLQAQGLSVTAVQLPLTSFENDVATARRAIALVNGPIVLVGHSYGGAVITETGTDPNVAAVVYIAAFAPDVGQSAGSLGASVAPAPMAEHIRPDKEGYLKLTAAGIKENFAQDLTDVEKNVLFATQAPTSGASLGGNVTAAAWKSKPSSYLVATLDRAIRPELQRTMAKTIRAKTIEVASSHVAMLSHPQDTAHLIIEAASR